MARWKQVIHYNWGLADYFTELLVVPRALQRRLFKRSTRSDSLGLAKSILSSADLTCDPIDTGYLHTYSSRSKHLASFYRIQHSLSIHG